MFERFRNRKKKHSGSNESSNNHAGTKASGEKNPSGRLFRNSRESLGQASVGGSTSTLSSGSSRADKHSIYSGSTAASSRDSFTSVGTRFSSCLSLSSNEGRGTHLSISPAASSSAAALGKPRPGSQSVLSLPNAAGLSSHKEWDLGAENVTFATANNFHPQPETRPARREWVKGGRWVFEQGLSNGKMIWQEHSKHPSAGSSIVSAGRTASNKWKQFHGYLHSASSEPSLSAKYGSKHVKGSPMHQKPGVYTIHSASVSAPSLGTRKQGSISTEANTILLARANDRAPSSDRHYVHYARGKPRVSRFREEGLSQGLAISKA